MVPIKALIAFLMVPATVLAQNRSISDFKLAKTYIREIHGPQARSFYCDCKIVGNKSVDPHECGYRPYSAKSPRSRTIEYEHIVPASFFGRRFSEWTEGHSDCSYNGRSYRGRKCALAASARFRLLHADMYNLYPVIGELNARRQNYRFGQIPGETRVFGQCDFEVDSREHVVEVAVNIKGDVARAQLYMDFNYEEAELDYEDYEMFKKWDEADPVDQFECNRAYQIKQIQGNPNPFVEQRCLKLNLWPLSRSSD